MDTFNVIAIVIILAATFIELPLIISHTRDKNLVRDTKSNILLGIIYFLTDLFVNTIAFSFFRYVIIIRFSNLNCPGGYG